jgi:hypothetical protein
MGKMESSVAYTTEPPVISISGNVAQKTFRSGGRQIRLAMPVAVLRATRDRLNRALDRYAAGEEDILIDD